MYSEQDTEEDNDEESEVMTQCCCLTVMDSAPVFNVNSLTLLHQDH